MKKLLIALVLFFAPTVGQSANPYIVQQCWQNVQAYQFYLQRKGFTTPAESQQLKAMIAYCQYLQSH